MTKIEMRKCVNNLLWHLNPRKKLWQFQTGSFIWVCWLSPTPFLLSHIAMDRVPGGCCATSEQRWGACCSPSRAQLCQGRAHNANGKLGLSAHCHEATRCIWHRTVVLEPAGPESFALGQFSKLKSSWLGWRTSKQSLFIYFFSFPLTTCTNPPRLTFFHIHFLFSFPEKPLAAPLFYSWGSEEHVQGAEGMEPGRTHGGPSLAFFAGTDWEGMLTPCHLPPDLEGRSGWSWQRAAGWAQSSISIQHCLAMLRSIYRCCHCITQH